MKSLLEIKPELLMIARKAGDAIMAIYQDEERFDVEQKSDDSPLTAADKAANSIICDALDQLSLKYPIISEENKAIDYAERKNFDRVWLIDPLDGTKEFIKRNGEFTVNIALLEKGSVIMGVVYAPALDEMYWGLKGEGAYLVGSNGEEQLSAHSFKSTDSGLRVVCSRSHLNEETQAFLDNLDAPVKVAKGSSLKFLILANGDADYYPRLAPTMEWDTGAAQIILEEAGGQVLRADDAKALDYNKENLLNPYFIASGNILDK